MTDKRTGDRHRPGYVSPTRQDRRSVTTYLDDTEFEAAHEIADRKGMTITGLTRIAVQQYIKRNILKTEAQPN